MSDTRKRHLLPTLLLLSCFVGSLVAGPQAHATTSWGRIKAVYHGESLADRPDGTESAASAPGILSTPSSPDGGSPCPCDCMAPGEWYDWQDVGHLDCADDEFYLIAHMGDTCYCVSCAPNVCLDDRSARRDLQKRTVMMPGEEPPCFCHCVQDVGLWFNQADVVSLDCWWDEFYVEVDLPTCTCIACLQNTCP